MNTNHRFTKILQHKIEYWYINDDDYIDGICLSESDEEHIENMIKEGYSSGQLCTFILESDKEENGWWKIIK